MVHRTASRLWIIESRVFVLVEVCIGICYLRILNVHTPTDVVWFLDVEIGVGVVVGGGQSMRFHLGPLQSVGNMTNDVGLRLTLTDREVVVILADRGILVNAALSVIPRFLLMVILADRGILVNAALSVLLRFLLMVILADRGILVGDGAS